MGREELAALMRVLQAQLAGENLALGTWTIRYERDRQAFSFDKCQFEDYCEERPTVIALDGTVLDPGGPILAG